MGFSDGVELAFANGFKAYVKNEISFRPSPYFIYTQALRTNAVPK